MIPSIYLSICKGCLKSSKPHPERRAKAEYFHHSNILSHHKKLEKSELVFLTL